MKEKRSDRRMDLIYLLLLLLGLLAKGTKQQNTDLFLGEDVSQHILPTPTFYVDLACPNDDVYRHIAKLLADVFSGTSKLTSGKLRLKIKGNPMQTLYTGDAGLIYDMLHDAELCDCNMSNQAINNLLSVSYDVEVNSAIYVISDNNPKPNDPRPVDVFQSLLAFTTSKSLLYNTFLIEKCTRGTPAFRKRRAIGSSFSFYDLLAQSTGGTVITTSHSNVGQATDLIRSQLNTNTVHILKFPFLKQGLPDPFWIPVDDTVTNLTVQIQTPNITTASPAVPFIKNPSGVPQMPRTGSNITIDNLGTRLILIKFVNPAAGNWTIAKFDHNDWEVDVTAISMVDFTRKFIEPDPSGFGEFEVTGRPLAGSTYKLAVTVPRYDAVNRVDSALLLLKNGTTLQTLHLTNVGGRRGASLFNTNITIPIQDFLIAIEGLDKTGHTFRRLDPKLISPLALKLQVPTKSGNVYVNETYSVTYIVYNIGSEPADIDVMISDQDGLTPTPTAHSYTLLGGENVTRQFLMRVGSEIGHVDTVTVTAKPYLGPGKFPNSQYEIRRFTVIEHDKQVKTEYSFVNFDPKPVDNTTPTCNVTKITGTCDTGNELCKCNEKVWSMWVEIGDEGFGLQDIVTTGTGSNSSFRHDPYKPGHTIQDGKITANISDDCCHQKATITVVDKAGNTVQCKNDLNPNFVPPDPKTCPETAAPGKIRCNLFQIYRVCDPSLTIHDPCKCKGGTWVFKTGFQKVEPHNIYNIYTSNAGVNATIHRNHDTVQVEADCCHQQIYVHARDVAGNTGKCEAVLNPNFKEPAPEKCDKVPPVCDITKTTGTCNVNAKDLCDCDKGIWSMSVEIYDDYAGLQNISAVDLGFNGTFHYDRFTVGHTLKDGKITAEISDSCCNQMAGIEVYDKAGNINYCNSTLAQNFTALKKCDKVPPVCNVTKTTGTCNINATDLCDCDKGRWSMSFEIYDELAGLENVSAVDLGSNGTFQCDNFTVGHTLKGGKITAEISDTCCNQMAGIEVYDKAGNINHCNSTLQNFTVNPLPSCTTTTSTTATSATTTTTETTFTPTETTTTTTSTTPLTTTKTTMTTTTTPPTTTTSTATMMNTTSPSTSTSTSTIQTTPLTITTAISSTTTTQPKPTTAQKATPITLLSLATSTITQTTQSTTTTQITQPSTTTKSTTSTTALPATQSTSSPSTITSPTTSTPTTTTVKTTTANTSKSKSSTVPTSSTIPATTFHTNSSINSPTGTTSIQSTNSVTSTTASSTTAPSYSTTERTTTTKSTTNTTKIAISTPAFSQSTNNASLAVDLTTTTQKTTTTTPSPHRTTIVSSSTTTTTPLTSPASKNSEITTSQSTQSAGSTIPTTTRAVKPITCKTPISYTQKCPSSMDPCKCSKETWEVEVTFETNGQTVTFAAKEPSVTVSKKNQFTARYNIDCCIKEVTLQARSTTSTENMGECVAKIQNPPDECKAEDAPSKAPISNVAIAGLAIGSIAAVASIVTGTVLLCKAFGAKNAEVTPKRKTSDSSRGPKKRRRSRTNLAWI